MPPDRIPDWAWIEGEVTILAELVAGVASRGGCEPAAVLDAVAEELAARRPGLRLVHELGRVAGGAADSYDPSAA